MNAVTDVNDISGPPGPRGATGVTGARGWYGVRGQTGWYGTRGLPGATGATGAPGGQGPPGPPGDTGPVGYLGLKVTLLYVSIVYNPRGWAIYLTSSTLSLPSSSSATDVSRYATHTLLHISNTLYNASGYTYVCITGSVFLLDRVNASFDRSDRRSEESNIFDFVRLPMRLSKHVDTTSDWSDRPASRTTNHAAA